MTPSLERMAETMSMVALINSYLHGDAGDDKIRGGDDTDYFNGGPKSDYGNGGLYFDTCFNVEIVANCVTHD
jgi:hypothetical protein